MELTKVHSDNRGDLFVFNVGEKTHSIVTFNKGMARGGHYHNADQMHIILAGRFKCKLFELLTGEESESTMVEGDSILIPAKTAHLFTAEEFGVLAESRTGEFEANDYEPYRKLARPIP